MYLFLNILAILCKIPLQIPHTVPMIHSMDYLGEVSYVCAAGYTPSGDVEEGVSKCTAQGWSHAELNCTSKYVMILLSRYSYCFQI